MPPGSEKYSLRQPRLWAIFKKQMDHGQTPVTAGWFIPLPGLLLTKKAIVNACNENDQYCFKRALILP